MARILIGATPLVGHVAPLLPIARALVERGHEVRWYTGARFRAQVAGTGAVFEPMRAGLDFGEHELDDAFPALRGRSGAAKLNAAVRHVFADPIPGHMHDLRALLRDWPADVCLSESAFLAPAWLHERGEGPPWAVFNTLPMTLSSIDTAPFGLGLAPASGSSGRLRNRLLQRAFRDVVFRASVAHVDDLRAALGLPRRRQFVFDAALSPYLYLQGTVPSFEYPRSDLPEQVHFVGPAIADAPDDFRAPDWWSEVVESALPVVHVTQGTVTTAADQLLAPTIRALAHEPVLVVATTGGRPIEALGIDPLPANVRAAEFVPHACLLPHVDAMITNAGYNGVQVALAHGVPMVAAGDTEDKPEVAARIAWAGVGIDLRTGRPGEAQLRRASRRVLEEPDFGRLARVMAADIDCHRPALETAELLERLIATGAPVLGSEARRSGWQAVG